MNRLPYMSTPELITWLKLGTLASEIIAALKKTPDKVWHKKLRMACTLLEQVLDERLRCVEPKQVKTIVRRKNHTTIKLYTTDELRYPNKIPEDEKVIIWREDLMDILDLASNSCCACPQGSCVKECFYRKTFTRVGVPVVKTDVKDGECEFSWLDVGETQQIIPRNQRIYDIAEKYEGDE